MNEKEFLELFNRYLKEKSGDAFRAFDNEFIKLKNNKDLVKKLSQDKDLAFKLIDYDVLFILWMPQELLTEEMIEHTLKKRARAIQYIKKQTPSQCWIVLNNHIRNLTYIKEPTDEMKMFALNKGYPIEEIKNPTAEMCLKALKTNVRAIKYIKNLTKEMCFEAININTKSIGYIENSILTFEMVKQAVDQDLEALMYIPYEIINKKNVKYFCKKLAELLKKVENGECRTQMECDDCEYEHWYYQEDFNNLMIYLLNFVGE